MKNLLNCHVIGLHSFPISYDKDLYRRIFYAEENHHLWKNDPLELAIHPHHVNIKITVLDGILYNHIYEISKHGQLFQSFKWNSVILNGQGGFERLGEERLELMSIIGYGPGESVYMEACELHTVSVEKDQKAVWLIEEEIPTCEYFPVNYSDADLTKWTAEGLYQEVGDDIKQKYLSQYL